MIGFITKFMSLAHKLMESAMKRIVSKTFVYTRSYKSLLYIAQGSDYFLKEIYLKNYLHKSRTLVIGRFSKV